MTIFGANEIADRGPDDRSLGWTRLVIGLIQGMDGLAVLIVQQLGQVRFQVGTVFAFIFTKATLYPLQAIQDTEGRPVNGKEKKNIKEDITHQLLPQAFSKFRRTWAYIDLKRQLVIVDESSANKAEDLLGLLRASLGSLPVKPIALAESAEVVLTEWLTKQSLPTRFDLGDELELRSPQADGGIIRCKQEDLTREDVQAHATAGKQVVKLGLVWNERIECVLEADWALKRIKATDQLLDDQDDWNDASPEQKLDSDLALVSAELGALLDDLLSMSAK